MGPAPADGGYLIPSDSVCLLLQSTSCAILSLCIAAVGLSVSIRENALNSINVH